MTVLAMTGGDAAMIVLAVGWVVLVGGLLFVLLNTFRVLESTKMTIDAMREETIPLLREVKTSVEKTNREIDRVDVMLDNANSIVARVEKLSGLVEEAASSPLVKIISIASGLRKGFSKASKGSAKESGKGSAKDTAMIRRLFWIAFGVGLGATTAVIASRWTRKQAKKAAPATIAREAKGGLLDLDEAGDRLGRRGPSRDGRARARAARDLRARRSARLDSPLVNGSDIRETFLRFFEERGHTRVRSSSLLAAPESGLLLTGAGMEQFIPYFLGQVEPPFRRATSVQKCFRANDIENVGRTDRHLTLFEMLGNFSFGDYFKAESCAWGLELVTQGYGIDPDRLWMTVYEDDDEAIDIWKSLGISADRLVRRGKADNYWWTHAAGPAGPSSEIFVDRGSRYGPDGGPEVDEDRFCEIWNHVFMQHRVDGACELLGDLPNKNIDTGSSVERVAMVLQDKASFFETDLFAPLLEEVQSLSGKHYGADEKHDVAIRIVGEHARATAFLVADGVQPSNEGRGYILRRMLRRVVSASRQLGAKRAVFRPLVARVVDGFGDAYPELRENRAFIEEVLASEEDRFSATLRQGMVLFDEARDHADAGTVTGADAFKLSDTFGFPIELTIELAADAGLQVDEEGFRVLLQEQKDRARAAAKKVEIGLDAGAVPPTIFVGYEQPEAEAPITLLLSDENAELEVAEEGQPVRLFLERTPFYAEGGGQVGDRGVIRTHTGSVRITDTQKAGDHAIVHEGVVESGEVRAGQDAIGEIDRLFREGTARAHTSTHVIHATLRHILGEHARQAGSLDRARPPPVRLLPSEQRPDRDARAGGARGEPASGPRRRGADLRDLDGRGAGARRDRAVRREVRLDRPGRRDR